MILIDANLLLYAHDEMSAYYSAAKPWLAAVLGLQQEIALPLQSILAFVRVSTHPRLQKAQRPLPEVLEIVDTWLALPNVIIAVPGAKRWPIFKQLCTAANVTGNLSTDAHIAALAIEHDGELCSVDRDFERFAGLRCRNPLEI